MRALHRPLHGPLTLGLALAVALLAATGEGTRAASFQVSPTRFEFPLDRRFTNYFSVTNNSSAVLRLRITTAFLEADARGGLVERAGSPHDLAPWLVLNPRRFTLEPSARRVVRFSVRPPAELPPGEYRTVVFFEELPPRPEDGGAEGTAVQIQILTRLGVTIYGRVGDPAPQPRLEAPQAEIGAAALDVSATLHNAGTAHATVGIVATLLGAGGSEQGRTEQRITVQREQRRPVALRLARPPAGDYVVRVEGTLGEQTVFSVDLPVTVEPDSR